jgi:hypothetical protein
MNPESDSEDPPTMEEQEEVEDDEEYLPKVSTSISSQCTVASSSALTQPVLIPPLQAVSPMDIASFADLDLALRSHPEMAKEGAGVLNARAIARLVDGIRTFQSIHLGLVRLDKKGFAHL